VNKLWSLSYNHLSVRNIEDYKGYTGHESHKSSMNLLLFSVSYNNKYHLDIYTMSTPFWLQDPSILFDRTMVLELWPNKKMTPARKLNAITRLVILLTILGYAYSERVKIMMTGVATIFVIIAFWYFKVRNNVEALTEGLTNRAEGLAARLGETIPAPKYTKPTEKNPMMNVLLPEIMENPKRDSAEPGFQPEVEKEINEKTKNFVVEQFNNDPKIKELLFGDMVESMTFDQSMRNFYVNPATSIPNDQGAFAQFCYGEAISCKENNPLACERNAYRKYPSP